MKMKYVVGIDEVGRGPLAGPVTVCVVACEQNLYKKLMKDKCLPRSGKDSKKLSSQNRLIYSEYLKKTGIKYSIIDISNKIIDKKGISFAIKTAIKKAVEKLMLDPKECEVLLDGGLKAPEEFVRQKTIIKGDEKEKIISWASILAKVARDALMCKIAKKYPKYGFEKHKGYGTVDHRKAIKKYGLSEIHRESFCKKFMV